MKERPIVFDAASVRAIIDGRKTKASFLVKQSVAYHPDGPNHAKWFFRAGARWHSYETALDLIARHCPYGKPGDRLWVRETWQLCAPEHLAPGDTTGVWPRNPALLVVYRASSAERHPSHPEWGHSLWRSPHHLPREASRITLELTDVHVERASELSFGQGPVGLWRWALEFRRVPS